MQEDLERINQKLQEALGDLQRYAEKQIGDRLKDTLGPSLLQSFLKSMGFDVSALSGMVGKQVGLDPYKVLRLDGSASDEEVRQRYLELITKLHPDRAGQGFEFLATLVNVAYQAICHQRGMK